MKIWRYIHFSEITKTITSGEAVKEPYIWAENSPGQDYDEVTTSEALYAYELELIKQRKSDGELAYQETQAKMRVDRIANEIGHAVFKSLVYDPMAEVIGLVSTGNWLDAYDALESVAVNAILTEGMKTDFRLKIAGYLVDSGNYEEFEGSTYDNNGIIS